MKGERIRQARELCGLTQSELADRAGVAQSAIAQIESDVYDPSDAALHAIAISTGFDVSFLRLEEPPPNFPFASTLYRSLLKVSSKEKARAHRVAQLMFELALKLRKRLKDIPVMIPRTTEDPVTSARITRSNLGLSPQTPITNLTAAIERAGVLVLNLPIEVDGLDGFSAWVGPIQSIPMVCLIQRRNGYRVRATIGEEIGHLCMHTPLRVSVDEAEKQAKEFAGELLFPEDAMRIELDSPVTLSSLSRSKNRWGMSIQFQVVHAQRLGLITQNQYRYLMQQLSAKGWRREEPSDQAIVSEQPRLLKKMAETVYGSPLNLNSLRKNAGIPLRVLKAVFNDTILRSEAPEISLPVKPVQEKMFG